MANPISFPEANKTLLRPPSMTDEECGPLTIYTDGKVCVSLWELSEDEKQNILATGKIWLLVHSGNTQPPVLLLAQDTVFKTDEKQSIEKGKT